MALGKIITVYPLTPSSGAKYLATSMAYRYKDLNPSQKVAILDLNLYRPYLGYGFVDKFVTSSNNLDTFISEYDLNGVLGLSSIKKIFAEPKNDLYVLIGSREYNQRRHIKTEHISYLLDKCVEMFDMVFVTVATDVDNPGTVISLCNAWKVVVVGKHNHATFESFTDGIERIKHYVKIRQIKFVYNFFDERLEFHFGDFIIAYDIEVLGYLFYDEKTVDSKQFRKGFIMKKGLFKPKLKNEKMMSEIVKKLLKK